MAVLYRQGAVLDFYRRRAARLLPAYFVTVIITVIASSFLTLPSEHDQVVTQGLFASALASNIGFWLQNSYFSKSEFNPLLHLWSLGVEFQFYLIVPAIVWLLRKRSSLLLAVGMLSLMGALLMVTISPKTAFFMMPLRLWQFLTGAGAAWYLTHNGQVRQQRPAIGAAALGLILLIVAFYRIDGQATDIISGHPGLAALIVTIATAVVLTFGLPLALVRSTMGRTLARVGDWSYSIYLAHFPVIVLVLYVPFSGSILSFSNLQQGVALAVLITVASALLYMLVERHRSWSGHMGVGAGLLIATACVSLVSSPLSRSQFDTADLNILGAFSDRAPYRCGKLVRIMSPGAALCELTRNLPADAPALLLVGDSHADAIKSSFARVAHQRGYRLLFTVSNAPIIGSPSTDQLIAEARDKGAVGVIMHFASGNAGRVFETGFHTAAAEAALDLVWFLPVPTYAETVPDLLWRARPDSPTDIQPHNGDVVSALTGHLHAASVVTHDPWSALCPDGCMIKDKEGHPFYFDASHLTLTGARQLEGVMNVILDHFMRAEKSVSAAQ
ncbi:MAG: acyltransferase family protein [Paracoccaceae bacterium]